MPKARRQLWSIRLGVLALCLCLWELYARRGIQQLFPPPSRVIYALWEMAVRGELLGDILASSRRVAVGFALGSALGVTLGVLTGRIRLLEVTAGTLIQLLRPIPAIAILPFAIFFIGVNELSRYAVITFGVFFPVWLSAYAGIRDVNPRLVWAAASLGATQWQLFFHVLLPASLSQIITGLRMGIASAFICLVAAEMAGASSGLGYRVEAAHLSFRVDQMVAALVILGLLGAVSDAAFMRVVRWAAPWYGKRNEAS